jgi:hypothetical protein
MDKLNTSPQNCPKLTGPNINKILKYKFKMMGYYLETDKKDPSPVK